MQKKQKYQKSFVNKQYVLKGYLDQINPQFLGIGSKYASNKKQKVSIIKQRNNIQHEVSYIQKMNNKLDKIITKKKKQLQNSRQIRSRYFQQKKNKQLRQLQRQRQLGLKRQKSSQSKNLIRQGTYLAKMQYDMIRKQIANMTNQQKRILKTQKTKRELEDWTKSRIKVQQIEQDKIKNRQFRNQYFKSRNNSFILRYKTQIQKQLSQISVEKQRISSLSKKYASRQQLSEIKKTQLSQLNKGLFQNKKSFHCAPLKNFSLPQSKCSVLNTQIGGTSKGSLYSERN